MIKIFILNIMKDLNSIFNIIYHSLFSRQI